MNKTAVFVAMSCAVVLLCSGCDMFRKMAGRPTSKDIEAKRAAILQREAEEKKALCDSSLAEEKGDSVSTNLTSDEAAAAALIGERQLSEDSAQALQYRYYVIIGTFRERSNALKLSSKAESLGYKPALIAYRNGYTAVGIAPADTLSDAYSALLTIRSGSLSPEAWILDTKNKN